MHFIIVCGTFRSIICLQSIIIEDYQMNITVGDNLFFHWLIVSFYVSNILLICQILCKILASVSICRSMRILCKFCCEYEHCLGMLENFSKVCSAISFWQKSFSGEERGCAINALWNRSCEGNGVCFQFQYWLAHHNVNIFQQVENLWTTWSFIMQWLGDDDDEGCVPSFSLSALTARHRSKLEKH